ncbi:MULTISPECIES: MarR family winged helix-turn-helix transcriptional regulator [Paenibacillus]|uniref:MarR family winged helix-turn-helix transcriptional regulator n=1 Tax=Paenibacillus TaxID=44249 RepID=UPI000471B875|nr:MarR family transcriptional regulator [Paenibacillus massiliensis]
MIHFNAASLIGKTRDAMNKLIVAELEKHQIFDIVPSHGDILLHLYQEDGLSIKTLADRIHRTQPTVTVLVDKLQKFGYVQRIKSHQDSRVTLIHLTDKGRELEPVFRDISDTLNQAIYGSLSPAEQEQLEVWLGDILQRLST